MFGVQDIIFHFDNQLEYLLKFAGFKCQLGLIDCRIKYPNTQLGNIIRAKHPSTILITAESVLSETILELNLEKVVLLLSLINSLKKIFISQNMNNQRQTNPFNNKVVEDQQLNVDMNLNQQSFTPQLASSLTGLSTMSKNDKVKNEEFKMKETVENVRFHLNLNLKLTFKKLELIYNLPSSNATLKFSIEDFNIKFLRTILVISLKNIFIDIFKDEKKDNVKERISDQILHIPIV